MIRIAIDINFADIQAPLANDVIPQVNWVLNNDLERTCFEKKLWLITRKICQPFKFKFNGFQFFNGGSDVGSGKILIET